jgi:uncharacterized protein YkwD
MSSMKILTIFFLAFFISCNKDSLKDFNPMEKVVDSISDATTKEPLLPSDPTWNEEYIELVNTHRRSLGLRGLQVSPYIELAALDHSQNMADKTVPFGHSGSSTRCSLIISAIGSGNLCGEIVASGYKTPQAVFDGWIKSLTHKSKIENSRYTHTGMGFAKSSTGVIYWTQIFLEVN